jgi:hypothetical protein
MKHYLTTNDWIKSFLKITIERRAIYGNLENKINTLYLARACESSKIYTFIIILLHAKCITLLHFHPDLGTGVLE